MPAGIPPNKYSYPTPISALPLSFLKISSRIEQVSLRLCFLFNGLVTAYNDATLKDITEVITIILNVYFIGLGIKL